MTRYRQLVKDLSFEGKSILDIGCGFGWIIDNISQKTRNFDYTGCDITKELIKEAKKIYPSHKFLVYDYFANPPGKKYDIVLASGVLNGRKYDNLGFRKVAISTMFANASEALVFNMAGGHPQPKNKTTSQVYYVDSLKILKYCLGMSRKIIFRGHYHSKDFTIVMFK